MATDTSNISDTHDTRDTHDVAGDDRLAQLAAAIGEPARARMLCCLLDGHARTATELASVGGIGASTASGHLARLKMQGLVEAMAQGRHRYFRLAGPEVSAALEALLVVAGLPPSRGPAGTTAPAFMPSTPTRLRGARTCYDHMAGEVAVAVHDHFVQRGWLVGTEAPGTPKGSYEISSAGEAGLADWGIAAGELRLGRRRLACACMDWSERRPHLAGALGAAVLTQALARRWLQRDLDSRALTVTAQGRRALAGLGVALKG